MPLLPLIYAPNPIFKQKSAPVVQVDDGVRRFVDDLLHTLYVERGVGMAAPMVGTLQRIVVVDLQETEARNPLVLINPEIIAKSAETQTHNEASLSFPYIDAEITRPRAITLTYLDRDGNKQTTEFEGFIATVIQHEIDYLDGVTFLDYLSKMKRDMLLKKMQKIIKLNPPHVHGEHCHH